jgi:2-polyprenyl-6-methoxyphenol hydroxylase-like FAD-dependent oxidoreductase
MHHRTETGLFVYATFPGRPAAVVTLEYDLSDVPAAPLSLAEMEESVRRVLGVSVPLAPPDGDGPHLMRRVVGTNTRLAERFRDRRVLLVGDAAHVHSAIGGPGLNLGLQDTVNLGWKLAAAIRDDAMDGLLDTYETERRPVGQRVIMHTQAQSALNAPGPDVTALRELFGELLADPRNLRHIAEMMAGGDARYETGGHPLVGRFAPDMDLRTASGPARLAQLTRRGGPCCST